MPAAKRLWSVWLDADGAITDEQHAVTGEVELQHEDGTTERVYVDNRLADKSGTVDQLQGGASHG